ncbi:MAG: iron-sulfur cluster carrier protein ApbC [Rhodospirillaceae bacterium]|jgi:ATP-binding protein involved in chromosome partitioning|nr:iron-sulfur cluster carrier protein ApbC [Rhodospirillaceae bacterium]
MAEPTEQQIVAALGAITDPDAGRDIVSLGMIQGLAVKDGVVSFAIEVDPQRGAAMEPVRQAAEAAVAALPGIRSARAVLTAHNPAPDQSKPPPRSAPNSPAPGARGPAKLDVPGVRAIVAVASGKGGVGKSTVAVNLALGLAARGLAVGVMDSDIYGPSIPRMVGIDRKPSSPDGKTILPLENHGLRVMSMGFLVPEETPMIWRGPMVVSAIEQMLRDVQWGELDILIVDMPPGTGDAQLSLSQRVPLTGAVIVSTPQDIALIDARKGLNMFIKVEVPVLGIVENMSYFACPHCGERSEIFGHGGAREEADRLGVPFLGEIPLHMTIRTTSDSGNPVTVSEPDSPQAEAFHALAARVWAAVEQQMGEAKAAAPSIVFD